MLGLVLALVATASMVAALWGYRITRSSLIEDLDWLAMVSAEAEEARPPMLARVLDRLGGIFERTVVRRYGTRGIARIERRLVTAGRPEGFNARSFLRRKTGFGVLGILLFVFAWVTGQQAVGILLLLICWFWMDLWIRLVGSKRQETIDRELPDFLDVLSVTVAAGLGFRSALERVAGFSVGPVAEEMKTTLREMDLGLSRRVAFTNLRDRNRSEPLGSFVTAVLQSEELGVPLAQSLIEIASEIRREFAQQTRQRAAKAGPKVSLVVTVTIVPGAMILIASSLILSNLDSFSGVF